MCVQALPLFQHYLQLCEAHFEPDGVEVAQAFSEIAEAYTHIGRYGYSMNLSFYCDVKEYCFGLFNAPESLGLLLGMFMSLCIMS